MAARVGGVPTKAGLARQMLLAGLCGAALASTGCSGKGSTIAPEHAQAVARITGDPEVAHFYASRGAVPLWIKNGALGAEGHALVALLSQAARDGLSPARYLTPALQAQLKALRPGQTGLQADALLSRALVDYVADLHRPAQAVVYVDPEVAPRAPGARQLLQSAARAPSLGNFLVEMQRMNPIYEGLRAELSRLYDTGAAGGEVQRLQANLERARAIPADPGPRYIVVDVAGARLWMYENGEVHDEMRVVVGRRGMETPQMAALIRFAVLNPYWNIPKDLVRDQIAPQVLQVGPSYLENRHFEVLSDFTPAAHAIDPAAVNWDAVASGERPLKLRQLPGADNMMGAVKFMFPNQLGIYLHDTPAKALFQAQNRMKSSGCVRVEDAARLARWLFGRSVLGSGSEPEQRVDLTSPVPVYITYLTAVPEGDRIVYQADIYGRDPEENRTSS